MHPPRTRFLTPYRTLCIFVALGGLIGCSVAEMAVEPRLADQASPYAVTGANPRHWNQALQFGPWSTSANHDGTEFSWAFQAFGVGFGSAQRPYSFLLQGPNGDTLEAACHTRDLRLFRGTFEVDVTGAFSPALACALRRADGEPASKLTLAAKAHDYQGHLQLADGSSLEVRSSHRLAGSSLRSMEPVGYELMESGRLVAAVETLNRGRVWLAPDLTGTNRDEVAGAAAALLLFGGD